MESDDLKFPASADDTALDTWLRAQAALPPLADQRFTQRVMSALPPPRHRPMRAVLCGAGFTLGAVVALAGVLEASGGHADLVTIDSTLVHAVDALLAPGGIALGALVLSLGFAFRDQCRRALWPR